MGLEHQQAGQSTHPVDIGKARFRSLSRGHAGIARAVYGSGTSNTDVVSLVASVRDPLVIRQSQCCSRRRGLWNELLGVRRFKICQVGVDIQPSP